LYRKGFPGFPSAIQPDKELNIGNSLNASAKESEKRLKKPLSKLATLRGCLMFIDFSDQFREISSAVGIWLRHITPHHLVWNFLTDTL
jgi:hypothetical protein